MAYKYHDLVKKIHEQNIRIQEIDERTKRIERICDQLVDGLNEQWEMKLLLQSFLNVTSSKYDILFLCFIKFTALQILGQPSFPQYNAPYTVPSSYNVQEEDPSTRDIPKTLSSVGGKRVRESAKIRAFVQHAFDLNEDDNEESNQRKREALKMYISQLNSIGRNVCAQMKHDINSNPVFDHNPYWKDIPMEYKKKYLVIVENLANAIGIPLNRCANHWGAYALLSKHYQNNHSSGKPKVRLLLNYELCISKY